MSAPDDADGRAVGTLRFRPKAGQSLAALLVLAVLLSLGTWQVQRLAWKNSLLQRVAERMGAAPVPLPGTIADPDAWDLRPVTVTGVLRHESELYLGPRLLKDGGSVPQPGVHVLTPMVRQDGSPVLVDRGFVPDAKRNPTTRLEGQIASETTITGIARVPARPGWLRPANQPGANQWFSVDLPAMTAAAGLTDVVPLVIEADAAGNPGGLPVGGQTDVQFSNDHLGYALTWYGLAATLVGVWLVACFRRDPVRPSA